MYDTLLAEISGDTAPALYERALSRRVLSKSLQWMTTPGVKHAGYRLTPLEYRDGLALAFGTEMVDAPVQCDFCGKKPDGPSIRHMQSCKKAQGLRTLRHHAIRDALYEIATCFGPFHHVRKEPVLSQQTIVVNPDGTRVTTPGLRPDLVISGLFEAESPTYLDICVSDTDAGSYLRMTPSELLAQQEHDKISKYKEEVQRFNGSIAPFALSSDGLLAPQADRVLQQIAKRIMETPKGQRDWTYSMLIRSLRLRMQFSIIRAASMVLRRPNYNRPSYDNQQVFLHQELVTPSMKD